MNKRFEPANLVINSTNSKEYYANNIHFDSKQSESRK